MLLALLHTSCSGELELSAEEYAHVGLDDGTYQLVCRELDLPSPGAARLALPELANLKNALPAEVTWYVHTTCSRQHVPITPCFR